MNNKFIKKDFYTLEELAQAARHCIKGGAHCVGCPFYRPTHILCYQDFMKALIIYSKKDDKNDR